MHCKVLCKQLNKNYMLNAKNLLSVISFVSGYSEDDILSHSRNRGLVLCRHVYFHVARKKMGLKLTEIGQVFKCDHTTVIHGLNKIDDMIFIKDEITNQLVDKVMVCIKEKYLIPTQIFVSIPDHLDSESIIHSIEAMGCTIDKFTSGFDA